MKLIITFMNARTLSTSDNQPLRELETEGPDGVFKTVTGLLKGNQIIVDTGDAAITRVRYGWKPFSRGNLVNDAGWPASTFELTCPPAGNQYSPLK